MSASAARVEQRGLRRLVLVDDAGMSMVSFLKSMNMHRLTPSVTAVPNSDHQRMASSVPRGKNSRPSANTLGTKTTSDIQIKSVVFSRHHVSFAPTNVAQSAV